MNPFRADPEAERQRLERLARMSRRNCRGAGWHKRGYRDNGCMWINIRRGSYGHTRGMDVNEGLTIAEFWEQAVRSVQMEDGFPIPDGWGFELSSNKQVIDPTDDIITAIFDGGENVYVKIYDEDGQERCYNFAAGSWDYHVRGCRQ